MRRGENEHPHVNRRENEHPYVNRREAPFLRCGICDEPFEPHENTVYFEDERVHVLCRRRYAAGDCVEYSELDLPEGWVS